MRAILFFTVMMLSLKGFSQQSIYNIKMKSLLGDSVDFSNFRGKLLLAVNIASGPDQKQQMDGLQQLLNSFPDHNLVIMVFPSDDFGTEMATVAQLKELSNKYTFYFAEAGSVVGAQSNSIFKWLENKEDNGVVSEIPGKNFTKYLISRNGHLFGSFSLEMDPLDPVLIEAIKNN